MVREPVYKKLAIAIEARNNCEEKWNKEWFERWDTFIDDIMYNYMPSGSGIDAETKLNEKHNQNTQTIKIDSAYHTMDENGFYGRWIHYTVTIKPDLAHDIDLSIIGNFGQFQATKDYLYELYGEWLTRIVMIAP